MTQACQRYVRDELTVIEDSVAAIFVARPGPAGHGHNVTGKGHVALVGVLPELASHQWDDSGGVDP